MCLQGIHAALVKAPKKAANLPNLSASADLQEPLFMDAETTKQLATVVARMRDAVISGRRPGWDPTFATLPADSLKSEVKKLGPIKPIKGAEDVLNVPKIIQVANV